MSSYCTVCLERLFATANLNYGPTNNFPKFPGVQLLSLASGSPPQLFTGPAPGAAVAPGPYAITPEDHFKYYNLFNTYDTNKDGYVLHTHLTYIYKEPSKSY